MARKQKQMKHLYTITKYIVLAALFAFPYSGASAHTVETITRQTADSLQPVQAAGYGTPTSPTFDQVSSTAPTNYYDNLSGLSAETLRNELQSLVVNSNTKGQNYGDMWQVLKEADEHPNNSDQVWLIYRETGLDKTSQDQGSSGDYWNREHIFPQSIGGFSSGTSTSADGIDNYFTTTSADTDHAHADGHHLRASHKSENSSRGNNSYDYVNGARTVDAPYYEPPLSAKGDVARALFYMALRYDDLSLIDGAGTTGSQNMGKLSTLLEWHEMDPADDYEMHRNNVVYTWQNNRNPFIDHPELVEFIYGERQGDTYIPGSNATLEVTGSLEYFGTVMYGNTSESQQLTFSGENLTEDFTVTASEHFEVSTDNNTYGSTLTLPLSDGTLAETVVYVRFRPTSAVQTVVDGTIDVQNTNFHRTYEVSGKEGDPALDPITILYQDFEDDSYMDWQRKTLSGDRRWQIKEYNQNKYMQMSGYESNKTESKTFDTYLISPPLDLDQYKNEILTFATKNGYYNGTTLTVLISTDYDGQNPITANWTELTATLDETDHQGYGDNFIPSGEVDLSSYQGTAYLAYRYLGDNDQLTTTYQVDDILIEGNWEDFSATMATNVSAPPLVIPYTTPGIVGATQSYDLTFSDITEDISINADGYFEISIDGTNWSKTLTIPSTASSPQTIQVRYTPHVEHYASQTGTITHKTADAKTIALEIESEAAGTIADGNSLNRDQTLDVVAWNLNWFGAPEKSDYATTYDEQLEAVSAKMISLDADIYALQEVVSDEVNGDYLTPLVEKLNELAGSEKYTAILSERYSGDDSQPSTDFPSQRLCYVFNTQTVAGIMDTAMFSDVYPHTQTSSIEGYEGDASSFWAYGRLPHMLEAYITIAGTTNAINLVNLHAKCCSDGYERRKDDGNFLLNELNNNFSDANLVVLGDFNDYLDGSTSGVTSPYKDWFSNDYLNFQPFSSSGIDHVVLSNELYYEAQSLAPNSSAPEVNISDHDPVLLRMQLFSSKEVQSITFDALASSVYGAEAVNLSAEASSGLPISYHVESGPGRIQGDQVAIEGAGEIVVVAYQPGDATFQPAVAKQKLVVAKADQTITFTLPAEMDIRNAPLVMEASASSGLPVSYAITSGQGTISGNEFTPDAAGTYTIEAAQAGNANYNAAESVSQTIEVTGTTDIVTTLRNEVRVYPNPVNRILSIELPTDDKATITLLNVTGRVLKQFTAEESCKLNVQPYRNGIYFIKIETPKYTITKRIMVSR